MSNDPTNPNHYVNAGISGLEVGARSGKDKDFAYVNVSKYLLRAELKGSETLLTDLKKARWYLNWVIAREAGVKPFNKDRDPDFPNELTCEAYARSEHPLEQDLTAFINGDKPVE